MGVCVILKSSAVPCVILSKHNGYPYGVIFIPFSDFRTYKVDAPQVLQLGFEALHKVQTFTKYRPFEILISYDLG